MDLNNIPIGYFIVFKTEGDFIQRQIVNAQVRDGFSVEDSQYVHVEPSIGNSYSINANIPFIKPSNFIIREAGRYIKIVRPRFKNNLDMVIDYEVREGRFKTALWSASRSNLLYGFLGLLWFPLKNIIRMRNLFSWAGDFCSELAAFGLYREYCSSLSYKYNAEEAKVLPKHYNQMMPADFLNSSYFEVVDEMYIPKLNEIGRRENDITI